MDNPDSKLSLSDTMNELIADRQTISDDIMKQWDSVPDDSSLTVGLPKSAWKLLHAAIMQSTMSSIASANLAVVIANGSQEDRDAAVIELGKRAISAETAASGFLEALTKAFSSATDVEVGGNE